MYIREKTGRYAGEIREFPPHIALRLIAEGHAENPYADPEPKAKEEPVAVQPVSRSSRRKS